MTETESFVVGIILGALFQGALTVYIFFWGTRDDDPDDQVKGAQI